MSVGGERQGGGGVSFVPCMYACLCVCVRVCVYLYIHCTSVVLDSIVFYVLPLA